MKDVAVIYRSKYGATKRYAMWLKEALDADVFENKGLSTKQLQGYRAVILAGGLHAGGIPGISFLERNADELKKQRLYVLGVGASPACPQTVEELIQRHGKGKLAGVPMFYARGAWNVEAMKPVDRAMCALLYRILKNKPADQLPPGAKALVESWHEKADWTDKRYLMPLISRVLEDLAG